MPNYRYKARDSKSEFITGEINAASSRDAVRKLRVDGIVTSDVWLSASGVDSEKVLLQEAGKNVKREEVIAFAQQLSVMIDTGVPLSEAMDAILRNSKSGPFKRVLTEVTEDITSGLSFSNALDRWPRVFPTLMISLMRASEASGTMGPMLSRLSHYLGKERKTIKQIKGALTYPAVMMTIAVIVTGFLMVFVLPRFAGIYKSRSAELPLPTQVLMSISDFMIGNAIPIGIALVATGVALFIFLKQQAGQRTLDWLRLNVPLLSTMYKQLYITRAMRTMSTLIEGGVDLLDSIEITRGVTNNYYYERFWNGVVVYVKQGRQFSDVFRNSNLFSPMIAQMVDAGERSGQLADVMDKVAVSCEEDLDEAVKKMTQYIEPLMISFMGILVGSVAIALLLPIFSIGTVMSQ
ncbi:MAG: type II secretion system F family protein [Phycisphaerales bacterium]|nr:type II secretion system F family protein [Phycisphaerales bacterium]